MYEPSLNHVITQFLRMSSELDTMMLKHKLETKVHNMYHLIQRDVDNNALYYDI